MKVDIKVMKKRAQSLVEYGLILALVAVVAVGALQLLGKKVNDAAVKTGKSIDMQTDNAPQKYCESIGCSWSKEGSAEGVCDCGDAKTE